MKVSKSCIVGLLFVFINFSVQSAQHLQNAAYPLNKPLRTVLTGRLPVGQQSEQFLVYDYSDFYRPDRPPVKIAQSNNGLFKCELELTNPVYLVPASSGAGAALPPGYVFRSGLNVRYISMGILIEPGDSIFVIMNKGINEKYAEKSLGDVTIKTGLFDEIPFFNLQKFSGKGAEKLWCIQEIIKNTKNIGDPVFAPTLEKKLLTSDSIFQMVNSTVMRYKDYISPAILTVILSNYLPMLAFDISEILTGEAGKFSEGEINLNDDFVKKLYNQRKTRMDEVLDPNDPNLLYSFWYPKVLKRRAILEYCIEKKKEFYPFRNEYRKATYDIIAEKLEDSQLKVRILGNMATYALAFIGLGSEGELMVTDFIKYADAENKMAKGVYKYYTTLKQSLSKGYSSFQFKLPDVNGDIRTMKEFLGKVVIMDFMYNGCPGCAKMVPYMTKVRESFNGEKDIVFIAVSIDKKKEDWLNAIGKFSDKESIQLNVLNGAEDPLVKFYNVVAYPQIVAIDKRGRLITNNATRPNTDNGKALTELIKTALAE